jgi:hypothetical protein
MYKTYKNKSDDRITAERSYSYSKHYLILNETRTVLCQLPCSEVEDNLSWIEDIAQVEYKERTFTLDKEQVENFDKWRKEKKNTLPQAAIGGGYTFSFTPTGLGTITIIKCVDGSELDVSHEFN